MRHPRQGLPGWTAVLALATLWACGDTPADPTSPGPSFAATTVPGHTGRLDKDHNGWPDKGMVVTGHYNSVYAADASGNWYWDLGDGRVYGTVASVDALDQATLDLCKYEVNYRGSFENDPFLDNGWISNLIVCHGYSGTASYNYMIVHASDPRYRGNPAWAVWGDWEYHALTISGYGNLVRPYGHVGG